MVVQILQRSYTFDTQISRNCATVLVPASPRFECLNKMCLTLVNPINNLRDINERRDGDKVTIWQDAPPFLVSP